MYALIHSKDDNKKTKGSNLRVSSEDFTISVVAGCLEVSASENKIICSSAFDGPGPVKDITSTLTFKLTSVELQRILNESIAAGLLRINVTSK